MRATEDRDGSGPDARPRTDGGPQRADGGQHRADGGQQRAGEPADDEDDGYSTAVIVGVALLVGLPVLLFLLVMVSAVLGAFVLGLGDQPSSAPTVEWQSDYDASSGTLTVEHVAGDAVDVRAIEVRVEGQSADWSASADPLEARDTLTVRDVEEGQTVRIVWRDGDAEMVIGEFVAA